MVKNLRANAGYVGLIPGFRRFPGSRRFPGGGFSNPTPVFLPEEKPWTEEPGKLQFMVSQKSLK